MKEPARNILMLLAFTMAFSIVGYERAHANADSSPQTVLLTPGTVLLGGGVAGVLLIGMTHAGEAAADFAQGLAVVAAATAILVNGGPVWNLIGGLYGNSKSTTPTPSNLATGSTAPTSNTVFTTPTIGG